jgi:hypothetical protein
MSRRPFDYSDDELVRHVRDARGPWYVSAAAGGSRHATFHVKADNARHARGLVREYTYRFRHDGVRSWTILCVEFEGSEVSA